jgi:hypothetical protein
MFNSTDGSTIVGYKMVDIDSDFKTSSEHFLTAESKKPACCIQERLLIRQVDKLISGNIPSAKAVYWQLLKYLTPASSVLVG